MTVFTACCTIAYRLLFQLGAVAGSSGFFLTDKALIERTVLGTDHCVPWEAIGSIQPPSRPGAEYEIRHVKGVLRVPSYVLNREALIAAVLERSPWVSQRPDELPAPAARPAAGAGPREPLMRFAFVAIPFLIALTVEWHRWPSGGQALPGPLRIAIAAVPFIFILLPRRCRTGSEQRDPWFLRSLEFIVALHFAEVILSVIHGR